MNEDHLIAAILAAGMIAQRRDVGTKPTDAVALYQECLTSLIEANRPPRASPPLPERKASG